MTGSIKNSTGFIWLLDMMYTIVFDKNLDLRQVCQHFLHAVRSISLKIFFMDHMDLLQYIKRGSEYLGL
jgi:hypothetical protein